MPTVGFSIEQAVPTSILNCVDKLNKILKKFLNLAHTLQSTF